MVNEVVHYDGHVWEIAETIKGTETVLLKREKRDGRVLYRTVNRAELKFS